MRSNNNPLKAGLFIVVSFALAVAVFFGITGSSMVAGRQATYRVAFALDEDVGGLKLGNDVRIGGVTVGKVRSVTIKPADSDGPERTEVLFRIPESYALKSDATIAVQTGLTGQVNLNITSLGTGALATNQTLLDGDASPLNLAIAGLGSVSDELQPLVSDIRTITVPKVNTAVDNASELFVESKETAVRFRITADEATELVKHVRSKIDPAVERYNAVADNAAGAAGALRDVFGDTGEDIRQTMANLNSATGNLREQLPIITEKVAGTLDTFRAALEKTSTVLDDVRAVADNTRSATASIRSILTNNRPRIDEIIRAVTVTSQNLENASGEIRRSPWRLLYRPRPNEVANQNLYDSARQFADGARRLEDSAMNLRAALEDETTTPESIQQLILELETDFAEYQAIEAKLWEEVRP